MNYTVTNLSLQVVLSNRISDEGNEGFSIAKICGLLLSQQPDPIPKLICVNNIIIVKN